MSKIDKNIPDSYPQKEREIFQSIRKLKQIFSLKFRLVFAVMFALVLSLVLALLVDYIYVQLIEGIFSLPKPVEYILIMLAVGIFATFFISRWYIEPVKKIVIAMERVADGDFTYRLDIPHSAKEIQEIYSGFNMMAQELHSIEILQSDFVSNVSHEFKTPINAIEGYSMLLQDEENLTLEQKEYVNKIIFNTRRISTLTGSILLLSKLENQSIIQNKTQFPLDEQIRKSILALEPEWEKKDIEFDIDLDDTDFLGNEALLRHVWDNLISNAIKFSPYGGLITIRLRSTDKTVIFTVSDNGIGITDEGKKHIFDKFYQEDSSHKEKGNGLGLALVKKIVDLEGGSIKVKNNDDKGCTFTVVLDRHNA